MSVPIGGGSAHVARELSQFVGTRTWPVVVLTDPITRRKLETKIREYRDRLLGNPTRQSTLDSIAKIGVLQVLLRQGHVSLPEASTEIGRSFGTLLQDTLRLDGASDEARIAAGQEFLGEYLRNAFLVVEDYATTGGRHTSRGTGLKLGPLA